MSSYGYRHLREDKRNEMGKLAKRAGITPSKTIKPTLELYRPPSASRVFTDQRNSGDYSFTAPRPYGPGFPMVGVHSSVFPEHQGGGHGDHNMMSLISNMSVNAPEFTPMIQHKSTQSSPSKSVSTSRVHFQLQEPQSQSTSSGDAKNYMLKRSKSLGATDMKIKIPQEFEMGGFGHEVLLMIRKVLEDPSKLNSRQLMELVRHIFTRALETTRNAEPAAKLCTVIVERDTSETFLEALLNSCRQWYRERDRLLKEAGSGAVVLGPSVNPSRWVAYITFLYELHAGLKHRHKPVIAAGNLPPGAMLLTLLCECCHLFLKPPSLGNLSEIECLFFIMTSIGRDFEHEIPQRLVTLMNSIRDAFLTSAVSPGARKTLMQLIELQASKWQLQAPAVMYYYPSNRGK